MKVISVHRIALGHGKETLEVVLDDGIRQWTVRHPKLKGVKKSAERIAKFVDSVERVTVGAGHEKSLATQ